MVQFLEWTSLFLYDIKIIDSSRHNELCGVDNDVILSNARNLAKQGAEIIFRAPLVPGLNDSLADVRRLGDFIMSLCRRLPVELMPYHFIGSGKYQALGMVYPLPDVPELLDAGPHAAVLEQMGVTVIVP